PGDRAPEVLVTLAGVSHIIVSVSKVLGTTPSNQKLVRGHDHLSEIILPKPFPSKLALRPCGTRAGSDF
ncbi:hypothetical protein MJM79_21920, partial [Salmonella enterica subsp. enterica serovar Cerro]|nr:hypothetical protein [Salmonella enterica subsp. enterica serovar Cerro]